MVMPITLVDVYFWLGAGAMMIGLPIAVYLIAVELKRRYG